MLASNIHTAAQGLVDSARPANQMNGTGTATVNGSLTWTGSTGERAGAFMPPTCNGVDTIFIALDLGNASSANWTHQNNDVVDDSRDWRGRIFKWTAFVSKGEQVCSAFAWNGVTSNTSTPSAANIPSPGVENSIHQSYALGFGQSLYIDGSTKSIVADLIAGSNVPTTVQTSSTAVRLYCDPDTGKLHVSITAAPVVTVFFWLEASGRF